MTAGRREVVGSNEYLSLSADADRRLAFMPGGDTTLGAIDSTPAAVDLLVGPEGGLSDRERDDVTVAGFTPASLGPRILRSETAAITAVALVQGRWGDLQA